MGQASPVDILYPIRARADNTRFFERLRCSVESIRRGPDTRVCIADISDRPLLAVLKNRIGPNFKYVHSARPGLFRKSYTINLGVKHLVASPYFLLSDIDMVYRPGFVACLLKSVKSAACIAIPWRSMSEPVYSSDWFALSRLCRGSVLRGGGNFFISLALFRRLNGFDEAFVGYGYEDRDFHIRAEAISPVLELPDDSAAIHLYHKRRRVIEGHWMGVNHKRYLQHAKQLARGKMKPGDVNPGGWGIIEVP